METNQSNKKNLVDKITKLVVNLLKNYKLVEETKLVAICEDSFSPDFDESKIIENNKSVVNMELGFDSLSTRDKLLVVKACVNTHYDLLEGKIPSLGDIISYKLVQSDGNCFYFDTLGKLIAGDFASLI